MKPVLRWQVLVMGLLCACQSAPATPSSLSPTIQPASLRTAQPMPQTVASSSPVMASAPLAANPTSSDLPAGISEDRELKTAVHDYLSALIPNLQEKTLVSRLTRSHALQILKDVKDTAYHVQAQYVPLPPSALQTLMLRQGLYASDNLLNAYFSDGDPARLFSRLKDKIASSLGAIPFTHYGLSVLRREANWVVSLVLFSELVQLQGLQLEYPGPVNLKVQGTVLAEEFSQPEALVTRPDGRVEKLTLSSRGSTFELPLQLSEPGYYSFEINLTGPLGPQPATNFVLAVAQPYPLAVSEPEPVPTPLPDLSLLRSQLLALVNRDRQSMGAGALQPEASLDAAAQAHSEEMIAQGYVGHNSPWVGSPQKQVARSGISEPVAQNIALSHSPENAQRELMSSPGHRQTLIRPEWTHVGFGIAQAPDGFLYITQNFIQRRVELQPLPARLKVGESLQINAISRVGGVWLGVFLDGQIQGNPIPVQAGEAFQKTLSSLSAGKHQLRIGLSPPPVGQTYEFSFTNVWDFQVE